MKEKPVKKISFSTAEDDIMNENAILEAVKTKKKEEDYMLQLAMEDLVGLLRLQVKDRVGYCEHNNHVHSILEFRYV